MRIETTMSVEEYSLNYRRHAHVNAYYKNRPVVGVRPCSDFMSYDVQVLDREGIEHLTASRHEHLRIEAE